jgi:hypothetical protein
MRDFFMDFFTVSGARIQWGQELGSRGWAGERLKERLQGLELRVVEMTGFEHAPGIGVAARGCVGEGRVVGEHLVQ